jgi:hypothetical protein
MCGSSFDIGLIFNLFRIRWESNVMKKLMLTDKGWLVSQNTEDLASAAPLILRAILLLRTDEDLSTQSKKHRRRRRRRNKELQSSGFLGFTNFIRRARSKPTKLRRQLMNSK